ncbi:TetR/AcrR family transcriptional regulator [Gordonia sp. HY002]|uniref:TetR/AcrR family transcriptional regulator n=1 Tax=Gordonia zhenghanii TaxID=2911516 RepID=UPI001EF134F2|nr:TetR/AcrR family transcriptional regulator [Gordonia zhenghanii]MCF8570996.1 TetR/AcrR family transcriptional regulator [Gordonia zhenghanii]MCF8607476.1 TetR/AcrR family transcriptional regulator [Gordonia zhenghanii]
MDSDVDPDKLRRRFLHAGMTVLARDGYSGFKQAAVCTEAGVTTGAFYHSFRNWKAFESALIAHWRLEATDRLVESARSVTDPHDRIDALIEIALNLPHATERAIRSWASVDPAVLEALTAVEAARRDAIAEMGVELFGRELAERLASTAMLLLTGFENSANPSMDDFAWAMRGTTTAALALLDERQESE